MVKTIKQLIDETLAAKHAAREAEGHSGKFKPSKFGCCYRQQIWARKDELQSNPVKPLALRKFAMGNHIEAWIKSLLLTDKTDVIDGNLPENVIEYEDIKGFCDIIRPNEITDIKSQHSKSFHYRDIALKKGKDIRDEAHHHWMQVMFYVRHFYKPFGRITYVSKDDLDIREYVQPWDGYWKEQLDTELAVLRDFWSDGILPPAEPRLFPKKDGSFGECQYCDWQETCRALEAKK